MRIFKTPALLRYLFPDYTWRKPNTEKNIYLTFDDGPIPVVTEFVLKQLADFQAKAIFFCVGENISRFPEIAQLIVRQGHYLGNHTHNHLRGWATPTETYVQNIALCQEQIDQIQENTSVKLFRPPYGRIKQKQFLKIKSTYRVIMWDILTYDFDITLAPEKILQQALKKTTSGSVVVFHDSVKAFPNLQYVLPRYLHYFAEQGYSFKVL
ncbi:polysaccharide deacetylase family protein [Adhaeribacter pallidiroseus]|uniref:Putative 30.6 kDa protein in fumA 3'region n=1 Tax=Adhaeribacter pallidiroseus TaxID=2072847 RepID=A0A369QKE7_9BACT|nr:polysaccharide deacetylase family protein [Adhaeribacter pallidiroseus]RDC63329.1 putative 30.6 kDa protein in fumA 3'region [Adhaeribacter pallidiroseus]